MAEQKTSADDLIHVEKLVPLLQELQVKGLSALFHGTLPDSGDCYVLATAPELVTDYYNSRSGPAEEDEE